MKNFDSNDESSQDPNETTKFEVGTNKTEKSKVVIILPYSSSES